MSRLEEPPYPADSAYLVRRFRWIALLEGLSFLGLLGFAMPLKYAWGMPLAVRYVGLAHGILFILYVLCVAALVLQRGWSYGRAATALVLSVVPFGTFFLDRSLREELAFETGRVAVP
jgi:integral membrane protein